MPGFFGFLMVLAIIHCQQNVLDAQIYTSVCSEEVSPSLEVEALSHEAIAGKINELITAYMEVVRLILREMAKKLLFLEFEELTRMRKLWSNNLEKLFQETTKLAENIESGSTEKINGTLGDIISEDFIWMKNALNKVERLIQAVRDDGHETMANRLTIVKSYGESLLCKLAIVMDTIGLSYDSLSGKSKAEHPYEMTVELDQTSLIHEMLLYLERMFYKLHNI